MFSFDLLFGSVTWLYYLHYGFRQNIFLILFSVTVLLLYLWRAVPRMYGTTGWNSLLKSFVLLIGLEVSRVFFVSFTMMLSLVQTLRR
jgi:NADH:ubiquinone oxidoreductase subunit 3 (subunit A)